jgi:hypothetical protein
MGWEVVCVNRVALCLLSLLIVSCARYSPAFLGWSEWVEPDLPGIESEVTSSFDWSSFPGVITLIDAKVVGTGYKKAKLSPKKHVIEYADHPAEFGVHPRGKIEIDLESGHSYEFHIKYCFWCTPRKHALWVEDKTAGKLVWGQRPDWPSWYL